MKFKINLLLLILFLFGCREQKKQVMEKKDSFSISQNHIKLLETASNFNDLFEQRKIIQLETTEESLIGEISEIFYLEKENKILIADEVVSKSLFVFNLAGKFLYKIGRVGNGPGEYGRPSYIAYENKKIAVNSKMGKIIFYSLEGDYIDDLDLIGNSYTLANIIIWNNNLFGYNINSSISKGPDGESNKIFQIEDCNSLVAAYGKHEGDFPWNSGGLTVYNKKLLYSDLFNGRIYQIYPDKQIIKIFAETGELFDIQKLNKSENKIQFINNNIQNMKYISKLYDLKNMLIVDKFHEIDVLDDEGKILKSGLKKEFILPEGFEDNSMDSWFKYYKDGVICAGTQQSLVTEDFIPNPALILFELKN